MSKIYAVVEDGLVTNMIVWDGVSSYGIGGTQTLIHVPAAGMGDSTPGIGWQYKEGVFTAPNIEKSADEIARENMAAADSEYERASLKITAINERIADEDWDGTTESAVRAELSSWTGYRKLLRAYINAADWTQALPELPE